MDIAINYETQHTKLDNSIDKRKSSQQFSATLRLHLRPDAWKDSEFYKYWYGLHKVFVNVILASSLYIAEVLQSQTVYQLSNRPWTRILMNKEFGWIDLAVTKLKILYDRR